VCSFGCAAEGDDGLVLQQEQRVGHPPVVSRIDQHLHEIVNGLVAPSSQPNRDD
jgi:hypothetical protein